MHSSHESRSRSSHNYGVNARDQALSPQPAIGIPSSLASNGDARNTLYTGHGTRIRGGLMLSVTGEY